MPKDPKQSEEYVSFGHAIGRLHEALKEQDNGNRLVCDATIQRFEFTFELAWKTFKVFASAEGLECATPKKCFSKAFEIGWIEDEPLWLNMISDRNRTSHTYHEELANEILKRIPDYCSAFDAAYKQLEKTT